MLANLSIRGVYAASSLQCRLLSRGIKYVLLAGAYRLAMPLGDVPITTDQNMSQACQAIMTHCHVNAPVSLHHLHQLRPALVVDEQPCVTGECPM